MPQVQHVLTLLSVLAHLRLCFVSQVEDFFARLVQRTSPKSYAQAVGEVTVTRKFFENFCGDQVRGLQEGVDRGGSATAMSCGNRLNKAAAVTCKQRTTDSSK